MTVTVEELAASVNGEVRGDRSQAIAGVQSIESAGPNDLTFAVNDKNLRLLKMTKAGAAIVPHNRLDSTLIADLSLPLILVDDPLEAFSQVMQRLRPQRPRPEIGISPSAQVDPSAQIGPQCNVYPGAYIGPDVVIGSRCDLYPGVFIGAGCRIGDECTLFPHVVLYHDLTLGNRVVIHAGAVLGADGFGFQFKANRYQRVPQLGTVRIDDDVEIGAGTTIDRAMIGETVIGEGTKLDNQIMIAHNCQIGRHNAFASQVGLAGSVTTDDYVRIAGQAGVVDHVHVGEGATVAAKSAVHKDLPGGQGYVGQPARPEREGLKILAATAKLPRFLARVRKMELQIKELKADITTRAPYQQRAKAS